MDLFIEQNYPDVVSLSREAAQVFAEGLQPNPRKVKRALNNFRLMFDVAEQRWRCFESDFRVDPCRSAKLQVIQDQCSDAYAELNEDPRFLIALENWARRQQYRSLDRPDSPGEETMALFHAWLIGQADNEGTDEEMKYEPDTEEMLISADAGIAAEVIDTMISGESRVADLSDEEIRDHLFSADNRFALEYLNQVMNAEICSKFRLLKKYIRGIVDDTLSHPDLLRALGDLVFLSDS